MDLRNAVVAVVVWTLQEFVAVKTERRDFEASEACPRKTFRYFLLEEDFPHLHVPTRFQEILFCLDRVLEFLCFRATLAPIFQTFEQIRVVVVVEDVVVPLVVR